MMLHFFYINVVTLVIFRFVVKHPFAKRKYRLLMHNVQCAQYSIGDVIFAISYFFFFYYYDLSKLTSIKCSTTRVTNCRRSTCSEQPNVKLSSSRCEHTANKTCIPYKRKCFCDHEWNDTHIHADGVENDSLERSGQNKRNNKLITLKEKTTKNESKQFSVNFVWHEIIFLLHSQLLLMQKKGFTSDVHISAIVCLIRQQKRRDKKGKKRPF